MVSEHERGQAYYVCGMRESEEFEYVAIGPVRSLAQACCG